MYDEWYCLENIFRRILLLFQVGIWRKSSTRANLVSLRQRPLLQLFGQKSNLCFNFTHCRLDNVAIGFQNSRLKLLSRLMCFNEFQKSDNVVNTI